MGAFVTSETMNLEHAMPILMPEPQLTAGSSFTSSNCGQVNGSASGPALQHGSGFLAINGSIELSLCIKATPTAFVYRAYLALNPPPSAYKYLMQVLARGPEGTGSGSIYLTFTDESDDDYELRIFSSERKWHYVVYNSDYPSIKKIAWRP